MTIQNSKFLFLIFAFAFSFLVFNFCQAAVLSLEPKQGEYNLGDVFGAEIRLDSQGEYINAVECNLSFSPDILEARDFSQGNSILTLWIQEPSFSNQEGTVSLAGGVPGGYQGINGILGKIIFKAKQSGQAVVKFNDNCRALLNDGFGTEAALEKTGAVFNISAEEPTQIKDQWQEQISQDKIPPESFQIQLNRDQSIFEGKYFIAFSTTDKQTGLDYYQVAEMNLLDRLLKKEKWQKTTSPYLLKDQNLRSWIKVKAMDKAGNQRVETIKPLFKFNKQDIIWLLLILVISAGLLWLIIKRNKK